MAKFVWKVKNRSGTEQIEEIHADTAAESKRQLVEQGFHDLQLMQDDLCTMSADAQKEATDPDYRRDAPPEELLSYQEEGFPGFWAMWWKSARESPLWNLASFALFVWFIYEGSYIWASVVSIPILILPLLNWWFGIPARIYDEMNRAKAWNRWPKVLKLCDALQSRGGMIGVAIPEWELSRCRAQALAAMGRIDEAIQLHEPFQNDPKIERWVFLSHMSEIYEAGKKHTEALALRKEAVKENPDSMLTHLDLALLYAHRLTDPVNARQALTPVDRSLVPAMALPFLDAIEGMILCAENRHPDAVEKLNDALEKLAKYRQHAALEGGVLLAESYHCLALAGAGRKDEAEEYWENIGEFLKTTDEEALRQRIQTFLPQLR